MLNWSECSQTWPESKKSHTAKKNLSHRKKSYIYFRQQEFMKAAIINRIVVACSCNNNFLTKMFFFLFAALCNFLFLDKSTKTDRRRGKNDPQAKKFLRVTTNIMTLTTIVKRLLRLKLTRMARQLYPLKSSWKIDFTQCEKRKNNYSHLTNISWNQVAELL